MSIIKLSFFYISTPFHFNIQHLVLQISIILIYFLTCFLKFQHFKPLYSSYTFSNKRLTFLYTFILPLLSCLSVFLIVSIRYPCFHEYQIFRFCVSFILTHHLRGNRMPYVPIYHFTSALFVMKMTLVHFGW